MLVLFRAFLYFLEKLPTMDFENSNLSLRIGVWDINGLSEREVSK